ncbi:phosphatase PAP2 family protein [Hymenobacter humi]|uniref:Phosphatase PAP2 family protein n=1 Tax=Hymenobacter humi TaxID=1411620 RepID=A0ABW2U6Q6_9BACT
MLLASLVLPWVIYGVLAKRVWETGGFVGDRRFLLFLGQHASPALDKLAIALADVGDTVPMIGLALLITVGLLWRRHLTHAWVFVLSVGGSMLLTQLLKPLFARPRPELWASIKPAFTYSFPSGHAMDTAAVAAAVSFLLWEYRPHRLGWTLGPLFALSVGWARMYLGVHYPSDVLAGWACAVGWVTGVQLLFSPVFRPLRQGAAALPGKLPAGAAPKGEAKKHQFKSQPNKGGMR